jgi:hypothetical protein
MNNRLSSHLTLYLLISSAPIMYSSWFLFLQAAFQVLPHAVLGVGVLARSVSTASALSLATAAATLKDQDAGNLHGRLRGGMEDGDNGGGFDRLFRVREGKQEAVTEVDTSVAAEQDHVSVKENSLLFLCCLAGIILDFKLNVGLGLGLDTVYIHY